MPPSPRARDAGPRPGNAFIDRPRDGMRGSEVPNINDHPLLTAVRRTPAEPGGTRPPDAAYDFEKGSWMGPGGLLCDDPSFIPSSMQADIEAGEGQRGR